MHPFYFGDSDKQLYGVYDPPASTAFSDAGVLFCYPVGQEYMRSHWASRQLVNRLAQAGIHCLRFDYYGTGDSAGSLADADVDQWRSNITTGFDELKDMSGVSRISMVGLRFGATLAATARDHRVHKLVLWDPIVSGAAYVKSLRSMHDSLMSGASLDDNPPRRGHLGTEELVGFSFADSMIAEIEAVDLLKIDEFSASEIHLVVSEQQKDYEQLSEHLKVLGLLKSYQQVPSPGEWGRVNRFDSALIATDAINEITRDLTMK